MSNTPIITVLQPQPERFRVVTVALPETKKDDCHADDAQPILGRARTLAASGNIKYPFAMLKVGEGFYSPFGSRESLQSCKKKWQHKTGFKFTTHKQPDGRIFALRIS